LAWFKAGFHQQGLDCLHCSHTTGGSFVTTPGNKNTGNTSAQTDQLIFTVTAGENGYEYRAVFTNSVGTATTSIATLTVEQETAGGN
jgi:hypothetical protein